MMPTFTGSTTKSPKKLDRVGARSVVSSSTTNSTRELYKKLSRIPPDKDLAYERIRLASEYGLNVVKDKIPVRTFVLSTRTRQRHPSPGPRNRYAGLPAQGLARKPRPDSIYSPDHKTIPNCAAFSTPTKSLRRSLPYEHRTYVHHCSGSFGYTEYEARFLYLVARILVYFTCQQFLRFIDGKPGKRSLNFVRKLVEQGHASAHAYLRKWQGLPPFRAQSLRGHWQG